MVISVRSLLPLAAMLAALCNAGSAHAQTSANAAGSGSFDGDSSVEWFADAGLYDMEADAAETALSLFPPERQATFMPAGMSYDSWQSNQARAAAANANQTRPADSVRHRNPADRSVGLVPEPRTYGLMLLGLAAIAFATIRRRN